VPNATKKYKKPMKYTIFKTKWGYFGLAGTEYGLCRTCLPGPSPERTKSHLLKILLFEHRVSRIEHRESSIEKQRKVLPYSDLAGIIA
jgi:hypothetical protein